MALKGKKPESVQKRLKMFVYGTAGVGKTIASLQFPNAYIIDTEKGSDFYSDTISKANSVLFQSTNPDEIKAELMELLTTQHEYKTLIIDPVTQIYNAIQDKWGRVFEKNARDEGKGKMAETQDFGMRFWGKVKGEFKSIQRILLALDMNVIITAHQKDVYGPGFSKVGVTFDSMKGDDYFFDLIFRIEKRGDRRIAITDKERAEIGARKFPDDFEWSYDNFLKFYGKEVIERASTPVMMATPEQVERIKVLENAVKVEEGLIEKWLSKAGVDSWDEMKSDTIAKCIEYLEAKLPKIVSSVPKEEPKSEMEKLKKDGKK